MTLIKAQHKKPLKLRLARDLVRLIKRGHPWVFAQALRQLPPASPGAQAILLDNKKGRPVACGFYTPNSQLAFRVCSTEPSQALNEQWAEKKLEQALALRLHLFNKQIANQQTTAFRLFNGEGDGLPGLVCDVYGDTAVIQFDGQAPSKFWNGPAIATWLAQKLPLRSVYQQNNKRNKQQNKSSSPGQVLWGQPPLETIPFVENGIQFTVNVLHGQKTGFFLDQRQNRHRIKHWAKNKQILNMFGYTGGFSIYAGLGGASHVTTVDLAQAAIKHANYHWQLNKLPSTNHTGLVADAFEFLNQAATKQQTWDIVILDPPSFAPSHSSVAKGLAAYQKLIAAGAKVTSTDGILAAASCSSHIDTPMFLQACQEGISKAKRQATVLEICGQPADHPSPLALPEFRYLKFILLQIH